MASSERRSSASAKPGKPSRPGSKGGKGKGHRRVTRASTTEPPRERRYGDTVLRRMTASSDMPNVLFISFDDCNDWVGFLRNHPGTHTPNLDALARESLVFDQAHCT